MCRGENVSLARKIWCAREIAIEQTAKKYKFGTLRTILEAGMVFYEGPKGQLTGILFEASTAPWVSVD